MRAVQKFSWHKDVRDLSACEDNRQDFAGDAARLDLAPVGHELAEHLRVLVVDELAVVLAELAVLAPRLAGDAADPRLDPARRLC